MRVRARPLFDSPDDAIVALHSSMELEAVWLAVRDWLEMTIPTSSIVLAIGTREEPTPSCWSSPDAISPRDTLLSVIGDGRGSSPVFRVPRSVGRARWTYAAGASFPDCGYEQAVLGLHRTVRQGDFTDRELDELRRIHPHIATALRTVRTLQREHVTRLALQKLLSRLPLAIILLDWDGRPLFRNSPANDLCATWNFGAERARRLNTAQVFRVPQEIRRACRGMMARHGSRDARIVRDPGGSGLSATIDVLRFETEPLSRPRFLIYMEQAREGRKVTRSEGDDAARLALLIRLSPREREIAELICRGDSNAEIARALNKSVLTVKKQLQNIYKKLRIDSRGKLAAALRS